MNREQFVRENFGVIVKLALRHWQSLPPSATVFLSVEDMIGEVIAHVVQVYKRYDPERSRPDTFVWHVADNYCKTLVQRYRNQKRFAPTISVELVQIGSTSDRVRLLTAKDVVERVIEFSSTDTRRFLHYLLQNSGRRCKSVKLTAPICQEIRSLAKRCGATSDDFRLVMGRILVV